MYVESVLTEVPVPYRSYFFTGDLRPAHISPPRPVPDSIVKPDYAVTGIPVSEEAARTDSDSIPVIQGDQVEDLRYVACVRCSMNINVPRLTLSMSSCIEYVM